MRDEVPAPAGVLYCAQALLPPEHEGEPPAAATQETYDPSLKPIKKQANRTCKVNRAPNYPIESIKTNNNKIPGRSASRSLRAGLQHLLLVPKLWLENAHSPKLWFDSFATSVRSPAGLPAGYDSRATIHGLRFNRSNQDSWSVTFRI